VIQKTTRRKFVAKDLAFPGKRLTPQLQERFYRAVESMAKVRHPCICTIFGSFPVSDSGATILSPHVEGSSLKEILDNVPGWWCPTAATIVVLGVALGMRFAHGSAVFHGGLKPSNVIVDKDGRVHVCDFGEAAFQSMGIAANRATEAALYLDQNFPDDSDEAVARADVYAFGIMLYEIVMMGKSSPGVLRRITFNKLLQGKRPEVPADVVAVTRDLIEMCWANEPVQRPSFGRIYQIMEQHDFKLFENVNMPVVELYLDSVSEAIVDEIAR